MSLVVATTLNKQKSCKAFSLLELSIVLVIVATLTGIGITSGANMLETSRQVQTNTKMEQIKRALYAFRVTNNRIPCPSSLTLVPTSTNFGVEGPSLGCVNPAVGAATATRVSTDTVVAEGGVPTKTLNLPDEFAFDGWGNRIRYAVNMSYTDPDAFVSNKVDDSCKGAQILDGTGASNFRTQSGVYALISHGASAHGAYTRSGVMRNTESTNAQEQRNCSCDVAAAQTAYTGVYVQREKYQNPASSTDAFDDIVEYQVRWQMQSMADSITTTGAPVSNLYSPIGILQAIESSPVDGNLGAGLMIQYDPVLGFTFLPATNISPHIPAGGDPYYYDWSYDNKYLAVKKHNGLGGGSEIYIYKRIGNTISQVFTLPRTNLDSFSYSIRSAWSHDGNYLATTYFDDILAPPWTNQIRTRIWKRTGDSFAQLFDYVSTAPTHMVWTPDDKYLVSNYVLNYSGSNQVIRNNGGDSFTVVPSTDILDPVNAWPYAVNFSSDGVFAAAKETATTITIWRKSAGVYRFLKTLTIASNTIQEYGQQVTFSPDTRYLGVVLDSPQTVTVFERCGNSFTQLPPITNAHSPGAHGAVTWTPDSKFFSAGGYQNPGNCSIWPINNGVIGAPVAIPIVPGSGQMYHCFGFQFVN